MGRSNSHRIINQPNYGPITATKKINPSNLVNQKLIQPTSEAEPVQSGDDFQVVNSILVDSKEGLCHQETYQPEQRDEEAESNENVIEADSASLEESDTAPAVLVSNGEDAKVNANAMPTPIDIAVMSDFENPDLDNGLDSVESTEMSGEELLPLEWLEEECGVSIRTLRTWCINGKIKCDARKLRGGRTIYRARIKDVMTHKSSPRRLRTSKSDTAPYSEVSNMRNGPATPEFSENESPPWEETAVISCDVPSLPTRAEVEVATMKIEEKVRGPVVAPISQVIDDPKPDLDKRGIEHQNSPEEPKAPKCKDIKSGKHAVNRVKNWMRKFERRELLTIMKWVLNRIENPMMEIKQVGKQR